MKGGAGKASRGSRLQAREKSPGGSRMQAQGGAPLQPAVLTLFTLVTWRSDDAK